MVKVQSETQSIGSEISQKGKNERRGQRVLSEICKTASHGPRCKLEVEEKIYMKGEEEMWRWKDGVRTLVIVISVPYDIITLLDQKSSIRFKWRISGRQKTLAPNSSGGSIQVHVCLV